MSAVLIMFVFTDPAQFVSLNGSTPETGMCSPLIVLMDGRDGEVTIKGAKETNQVTIDLKLYDAYPSQGPENNPTTLTVAATKHPLFQFNVMGVDPKVVSYYLGGLALKSIPPNNGISQSGDVGGTFQQMAVAVDHYTGQTTLTVQDEPTGSMTYDFWTLVQDANGNVGLIDPRIVNTN